jgi:hypothetical protein
MTDLAALGVELCTRMTSHPAIRPRLDAVLWIGSASRGLDVHDDSDLDIQVVMDRPDAEATSALTDIFAGRSAVDLSIIYRAEIFSRTGQVSFQDGTKGSFFIYVLASAVTLYGTNPYDALLDELTLDEVRPSVMFTIREYLARLRVMVVRGGERSYEFKKYSVKLLRDILVYTGELPLLDMPHASNYDVLQLITRSRRFPASLRPALDSLLDLTIACTVSERAQLLMEYEKLTQALLS